MISNGSRPGESVYDPFCGSGSTLVTAHQLGRIGAAQAFPESPLHRRDRSRSHTISRQACHKAFRNAIAREPALEVEGLRRLDNARSEEMLSNLIRKGDVRAIEVGITVLDHTARINGYAAPHKHELTGKDGRPLTVIQLLGAIGPISNDEKRKVCAL